MHRIMVLIMAIILGIGAYFLLTQKEPSKIYNFTGTDCVTEPTPIPSKHKLPPSDIEAVIVAVEDKRVISKIKNKYTGEELNIWDYYPLNNGVTRIPDYDAIEKAYKEATKGMSWFEKSAYLAKLVESVPEDLHKFSAEVKKSNKSLEDFSKEQGWDDVSKTLNEDGMDKKLDDLDKTTKEVKANGDELINNLNNRRK